MKRVSLTFSDLPPHQHLRFSFDLLIIRSWDGNVTEVPQTLSTDQARLINPRNIEAIGPDIWYMAVDSTELVRTTFSNWGVDNYGFDFDQAYPGSFPGDSALSRTGADEVGSLGYTFGEVQDLDSIYEMSHAVDHAGSELTIDLAAEGLQPLDDESWGLADVKLTLFATAPSSLDTQLYLPLVAK